MNILLTNDDGIFFDGIQALKNELQKNHNVYVAAPSIERSATSHAISLSNTITANKISEYEYSFNGYPADCVNIAIHSQIWKDVQFDLIVSGINKGTNLGTDVIYSGTVAGARQAFIHGISGIAISTELIESINFQEISQFMQKIITNLKERILSKSKVFYNINYPQNKNNSPKKIYWTQLGTRTYKDEYIIKEQNNNQYSIDLKLYAMGHKKEDSQYLTDFEAINNHSISVTPIQLDTSNYQILSKVDNELIL